MKQTIINIAPIGKNYTATIIVTDEEGTRTEMNTSNLTIAQGLRDGMGASAAAIAAVGSTQVIP